MSTLILTLALSQCALGDHFGISLARTGDLNGDGVPDLIIGSPSSDEPRPAAFVCSGRDGTPILRLGVEGLRGGWGVGSAGDVNSDGLPDVAVGYTDGRRASCVVHSGSDGAVLLRVDTSVECDLWYGSFTMAGDLNGDGVPDALFGCGGDTAEVHALSGSDGSRIHRFAGANGLGTFVRPAGDVDADGVADFLALEWGWSCKDYDARLLSGKDGSDLFVFQASLRDVEYRGAWVDSVSDLDGDGVRDALVGPMSRVMRGSKNLYTWNDPGTVYSGKDASVLLSLEGGDELPAFGTAVADVGDTDGDGTVDLAVCCSTFSKGGNVRVHSGRGGKILYALESWGSGFGTTICGMGDVDGDGCADFAVTTLSLRAISPGDVTVISGKSGEILYWLDRNKMKAGAQSGAK